jgi:hypothetical protein
MKVAIVAGLVMLSRMHGATKASGARSPVQPGVAWGLFYRCHAQ